ncbi:MAG: hypothetical protein ACRDZR_08525 [Acidimicrobiales bacterium]
MVKAVGSRVPTARKANPPLPSELMELAVRLESLARAQEEVRSDGGDGEPNYAAAFERLFTAVVRLNPLYAAGRVRALAP